MKYWILKINPSGFRITDWLRARNWLSDESMVDVWYTGLLSGEVSPGDVIFVMSISDDTEVILAGGRAVAVPAVFPFDKEKKDYFSDPSGTGGKRTGSPVAVSYIRFCLGVPLTAAELNSENIEITLSGEEKKTLEIFSIPENTGAAIDKLMRGRTTNLDLPFCKT
jgi:hypothetical protein